MNKSIFILLFFLSAGHYSAAAIITEQQSQENKILIVYLSRTENTKAVAELIRDIVGGDLVALELETPYPEDYNATVQQVVDENTSGFLPPLKTQINTSEYHTIFLGFPTWGMQLPPPIKSFLSRNNMEGKTVIPFNTHAGYGVGRGFQQVKDLCEGCEVLMGYSVKGGIERDGIYLTIKGDRKKEVREDVRKWLEEIEIMASN